MADIPIGSIIYFPSLACPDGFIPCDGRELAKKAYPELYSLIKDTWGETGSSFCVPDLRGQFIRGWDDGYGVDPDSAPNNVRRIGSEQYDTFQGHTHDLDISGEMSEKEIYFESQKLEYGTNTFSDNSKLTFNSIMAEFEMQEKEKFFKNSFFSKLLRIP